MPEQSKLYIVFCEKSGDPLPTILYQSHSLTEADRYLDQHVTDLSSEYLVTGGATNADWLRIFRIENWLALPINGKKMDVWVECADIVDGCFENIKSGADGVSGINKLIAQHAGDGWFATALVLLAAIQNDHVFAFLEEKLNIPLFLVPQSLMSDQRPKGYLIVRKLDEQADSEVLYMFHDSNSAHLYLRMNVVGERYDVLSLAMDNGLQKLNLHDRYTFREMDVWVQTVNIMDTCLMDNMFNGVEGVQGRVEDFWAPVDQETFQTRFLD